MEMPLSEILDRYAILKLKSERLNPAQQSAESKLILNKELAAYGAALQSFRDRGVNVKDEWLDSLYKINGAIWDLEADIRQGKEDVLGLEEVGRRAILMRGWNVKRIAVKNMVAQETGLGFREIKINHASDGQPG